jgi:hypothetical protein
MSRKAKASAATPASVKAANETATTGRTRGLRKGNPNLSRERYPPLPARSGAAASLVLGEELGALVYHVLEGIKRETILASAGRLMLERLLPSGRPIRLDLPAVRSVDDLNHAQGLILSALNDGRVTPREARELQEVVLQVLRAAHEAEPPRDPHADYSPEEKRRIICEAAAGFGMLWPAEVSEGS